jgi:hypothetical protein
VGVSRPRGDWTEDAGANREANGVEGGGFVISRGHAVLCNSERPVCPRISVPVFPHTAVKRCSFTVVLAPVVGFINFKCNVKGDGQECPSHTGFRASFKMDSRGGCPHIYLGLKPGSLFLELLRHDLNVVPFPVLLMSCLCSLAKSTAGSLRLRSGQALTGPSAR